MITITYTFETPEEGRAFLKALDEALGVENADRAGLRIASTTPPVVKNEVQLEEVQVTEETPEPEKEVQVTKDDVRDALIKCSAEKGKAVAQAILAKFSRDGTLNELEVDNFAATIKALQEAK